MRCETVRQQLAADPSQAARPGRLAAHLADCAACRAELARLEAVVAALERLPMPTPPAGLRERTMASIAERRRSATAPGLWWLRRPAYAALAAGLAVTVFWAGRPGQPPMVSVEAAAIYSDAYAGSHSLVAAGSPLADSATMHAMGALAERRERHP